MDVSAIVALVVAAGAFLSALWKNSAHKKTLEDTAKDTAKLEAKVELQEKRVDKLEWQATVTDKALGEIKEAMHRTNGKLQAMDSNLLLIRQWVDDQKRHERHEDK